MILWDERSSPMSSPTAGALLVLLSHHIGAGQGLRADEIARSLDCSERRVRILVSALRDDGVAVCGHPKTGYYIAATADELEQTCTFLRARAMHSLVLEARLRKLPLPDLLGQLRLPT